MTKDEENSQIKGKQPTVASPIKPVVSRNSDALIEEVEHILYGIDKDETYVLDGWWETKTGADFGKEKLEEIRRAIRRFNSC